MKLYRFIRRNIIPLIFVLMFFLTSCERHEYCAVCWEYRPIFTLGPGDVSFCSDDARLVDDFIWDYEDWGWYCEFRD